MSVGIFAAKIGIEKLRPHPAHHRQHTNPGSTCPTGWQTSPTTPSESRRGTFHRYCKPKLWRDETYVSSWHGKFENLLVQSGRLKAFTVSVWETCCRGIAHKARKGQARISWAKKTFKIRLMQDLYVWVTVEFVHGIRYTLGMLSHAANKCHQDLSSPARLFWPKRGAFLTAGACILLLAASPARIVHPWEFEFFDKQIPTLTTPTKKTFQQTSALQTSNTIARVTRVTGYSNPSNLDTEFDIHLFNAYIDSMEVEGVALPQAYHSPDSNMWMYVDKYLYIYLYIDINIDIYILYRRSIYACMCVCFLCMSLVTQSWIRIGLTTVSATIYNT